MRVSLETLEASRATYNMNDEFSLFCIHNIIYNRVEENHIKRLDFFIYRHRLALELDRNQARSQIS